jgi:hypothetical protein
MYYSLLEDVSFIATRFGSLLPSSGNLVHVFLMKIIIPTRDPFLFGPNQLSLIYVQYSVALGCNKKNTSQ